MSRKLFVAVAEGIRRTRDIDGIARSLLIDNIGYELAKEYPRFNLQTFRDACTPEPTQIVMEGDVFRGGV